MSAEEQKRAEAALKAIRVLVVWSGAVRLRSSSMRAITKER